MGANTNIQWATHSFNPWRGCEKVAPGCANCYADKLSKRNPGTLGVWGSEEQGGTRVVASDAMWREPLKWNREAERDLREARPRVFCASLCDVFEDWQGPLVDSQGERLWWTETDKSQLSRQVGVRLVTMNDVRARLFRLIDATPNLDWLLLTKRPENIQRMWPTEDDGHGGALAAAIFSEDPFNPKPGKLVRRRDNVWLGTSVATQEDEKNLDELAKCSDLAAKLFVSVEPLIEGTDIPFSQRYRLMHQGRTECDHGVPLGLICNDCPALDWVIVGGESGPNARPCNVEWIRDIVQQCKAAGVPCFVKQLGAQSYIDYHDAAIPTSEEIVGTKDPKGGDMSEWPEDLRVRELPNV